MSKAIGLKKGKIKFFKNWEFSVKVANAFCKDFKILMYGGNTGKQE